MGAGAENQLSYRKPDNRQPALRFEADEQTSRLEYNLKYKYQEFQSNCSLL